ncbi:hypothetical protein MBRA1_002861 [Malassezia brasiliensis]|uniref:Oxidoreductase n=1 Tax=Malassezia brasiliensis TaxID=1821822 RepID=A0AAF0DZ45_9BASI|nr:hypothetical protein MBRA1_002861 [Malassezia brasiliensis]
MTPIPVALLGYGNSARTFHLPFVKSLPDQFQLHVVLQRPRPEGSTSPNAALDLPDVQVVPDIDAALSALPEGGLVIITTNNASHFPYAEKALKANMHVLVEKPVAVHEDEVHKLAELAHSVGKVCTVYQNRRFDGDYLTLKSLIKHQGGPNPSALGVPTYYESRFDRFRPIAKGGWRESVDPETEGGGMLWDLGAHLVDQTVSLFGAPESVFGLVQNQRGQGPENVDDDWLAVLTYPPRDPPKEETFAPGQRLGELRAVLGSTCLSAHTDAEQSRFRVEGTLGSYVKKGTDPQEVQLKLGWTPATHPDAFGSYPSDAPSSLRFAQLTTSQPNEEVSGSNPPKLAVASIPTLPGRYIDLYTNLAETICAVNAAPNAEEAASIVDKLLDIKLEHVATQVHC